MSHSWRVHGSAVAIPVQLIITAYRRLPAAAENLNRGALYMLRINDIAPTFEAETTRGPIRFHEWLGDSWCVLFSHPKDFTPVCTTELGYMAGLQPEFEKRNCKIIGLSRSEERRVGEEAR